MDKTSGLQKTGFPQCIFFAIALHLPSLIGNSDNKGPTGSEQKRIQDFRNNEAIPPHFIMSGHTIQTMAISRIL